MRVSVLACVAVLVVAAAGCGGGSSSEGSAAGTAPTETTTPATGGETGDAAAGKQVFASAGCGSCHTFSAAGSTGTVGPNLDDLSPSYETVVAQVTNGGGTMPSFKDTLTEQQIQDVAAFVSGS